MLTSLSIPLVGDTASLTEAGKQELAALLLADLNTRNGNTGHAATIDSATAVWSLNTATGMFSVQFDTTPEISQEDANALIESLVSAPSTLPVTVDGLSLTTNTDPALYTNLPVPGLGEFDLDNSGGLDRDEWTAFVRDIDSDYSKTPKAGKKTGKTTKIGTKAGARNGVFDFYDANNDGVMSVWEMMAYANDDPNTRFNNKAGKGTTGQKKTQAKGKKQAKDKKKAGKIGLSLLAADRSSASPSSARVLAVVGVVVVCAALINRRFNRSEPHQEGLEGTEPTKTTVMAGGAATAAVVNDRTYLLAPVLA